MDGAMLNEALDSDFVRGKVGLMMKKTKSNGVSGAINKLAVKKSKGGAMMRKSKGGAMMKMSKGGSMNKKSKK